jgi:predicted glycosyltransferase
MRSSLMETAIRSFKPDVLIVDNVPRGALGELDATLEYCRTSAQTHCVLGLRDVLDDPTTVRREWRAAENELFVRDYYDAVWVYGDHHVYDVVHEYQFSPTVACKLAYTGYLDHRARLHSESDAFVSELQSTGDRIALCLVGGGQDGDRLANIFSEVEFPVGMRGAVLMGPYMPMETQQRLRARMASNPRFQAIGFVTDPYLLLHCADRVVAMGGYNTVYELLSFEKHALIVPRVKPRCEQLI